MSEQELRARMEELEELTWHSDGMELYLMIETCRRRIAQAHRTFMRNHFVALRNEDRRRFAKGWRERDAALGIEDADSPDEQESDDFEEYHKVHRDDPNRALGRVYFYGVPGMPVRGVVNSFVISFWFVQLVEQYKLMYVLHKHKGEAWPPCVNPYQTDDNTHSILRGYATTDDICTMFAFNSIHKTFKVIETTTERARFRAPGLYREGRKHRRIGLAFPIYGRDLDIAPPSILLHWFPVGGTPIGCYHCRRQHYMKWSWNAAEQ
jgi:hypothetical protein